MSKKIELTPEQTQECLRMYNNELLGSTTISERMGIHKTIIIRTLKENGVVLGPSGRRNIGGRAVAQKKYESKPEIKTKRSNFYKEWSKDNKEYLKLKHRKWREENREHLNKKARDYAREAIKGIGFMTTAEYKKGLSNGGTNSEAILAFYTDPNQYNKWRSFNSFHDSWDGMGDDFLCNSSLVEQFANNDIRRGFFLDERYYYKYYDGNVYGGKSYPVSVLITTAEQAKGYYTYGKFPRRDVVIGSSRGTLGVGDYIAIRATEMKLLIAECDARIGDNNDEAQTILFDIQKRSIPTAVKTTETGKALLDLIKLETRKELFGEGHSLRLIKRWGEGLKRDGSHVAMVDLSPEAPEFVWPTPEREITVNKNLLK